MGTNVRNAWSTYGTALTNVRNAWSNYGAAAYDAVDAWTAYVRNAGHALTANARNAEDAGSVNGPAYDVVNAGPTWNGNANATNARLTYDDAGWNATTQHDATAWNGNAIASSYDVAIVGQCAWP